MAKKSSKSNLRAVWASPDVPEILVVGHYVYRRAQPQLLSHVHPEAIEICYLANGEQTYSVAGVDYRLRGGNLLITRPGELHGTGAAPENVGELFWLQLRLPQPREVYLGIDPPGADRAFNQLLRSSRCCFSAGEYCSFTFARLINAVHRPPGVEQLASVRNLAARLLLDVAVQSQQPIQPGVSPGIGRAIELTQRHPDRPLHVVDLAVAAGMSVSSFTSSFRTEVGISPAKYLLQRRIEQARRLLDGGVLSIIQIAQTLQFGSSQYFSTVFRKYTGLTPQEARREPSGPRNPSLSGVGKNFHPARR